MSLILEILGLIVLGLVLTVLGVALTTLVTLLALIAAAKGVRALIRRASARHAAASADPQQVSVPVLLDLRRPPLGPKTHAPQRNWTEDMPW